MKNIVKIIRTLLAMGGFLNDKFPLHRILLLTFLVILYFLNIYLLHSFSFIFAVVYFLAVFSTRYIFLFSSFRANGIADYLKNRFGENKGFEIYKMITAFMFFQGASSFSLLITKSYGKLNLFPHDVELIISVTGFLLLAAGFIINLWATLLVGLDVYYYKDLFLGRPVGKFEKKGPYKYLSNPMYGWGQANGYGTAIMYGSIEGIVAMGMNQVLMYIFYFTVEKPHVQKLFGFKKAPPKILNASVTINEEV